MNIKHYIESGILEQYCMNMLTDQERISVEKMCLLYPEIRDELTAIELAIENYAEENSIEPRAELKHEILNTITGLKKEASLHLNNLPLISKYSDYTKWLKAVEHLIPEKLDRDRVVKPLRMSDGVMQVLIVSSTDIENETHENEQESFLILQGTCECTIGEHIFELQAGDFTKIPMYTDHDVRLLTPVVVAILQRVDI